MCTFGKPPFSFSTLKNAGYASLRFVSMSRLIESSIKNSTSTSLVGTASMIAAGTREGGGGGVDEQATRARTGSQRIAISVADLAIPSRNNCGHNAQRTETIVSAGGGADRCTFASKC